jgi:hypothetical protein
MVMPQEEHELEIPPRNVGSCYGCIYACVCEEQWMVKPKEEPEPQRPCHELRGLL